MSTSFRFSLYVSIKLSFLFASILCMLSLDYLIEVLFFPQVLLGITLSWLICYILTTYNVLPAEPDKYGYMARTDLKGNVLSQAPWFTFPYPGKRLPNCHLKWLFLGKKVNKNRYCRSYCLIICFLVCKSKFRSVGDTDCKPCRGGWHLGWCDFLNDRICRGLPCLCQAIWGSTSP